jgi:urease accessory protein
MLTLTCKILGAAPLSANMNLADTVALPYDTRCRTRLRVTLSSGREAGIVLPRSERLAHGDRLQGDDGSVVTVIAAPEPLLEARATELLAVTRAAYHLGNRHVPVQVVDLLTLRLPVDHVLAGMLKGLGLVVSEITAPFEPEGGAYGAGGSALHATDHTHMLDRSAPVSIRRAAAVAGSGSPSGQDGASSDATADTRADLGLGGLCRAGLRAGRSRSWRPSFAAPHSRVCVLSRA